MGIKRIAVEKKHELTSVIQGYFYPESLDEDPNDQPFLFLDIEATNLSRRTKPPKQKLSRPSSTKK